MNIKKLCKIYVGVGMVYAGTMFVLLKKNKTEEFDKCSIDAKVSAFADVTLTWPRFVFRIIRAFVTGTIDGYSSGKNLKESTNESDT